MTTRTFIDIHAIQTLPPSCVNRDDVGAPKTAIYGGATRSRVSSQAWKKAMRDYFKDHAEENFIGYRTKNVPTLIAEKIVEKNSEVNKEDALELAKSSLEVGLNSKSLFKKDSDKLKTLFFISEGQTDKIADYIIEKKKKKEFNKDEIAEILNSEPSLDLALFGRMVADKQSLSQEASAQVAHAISTHAIQTEFDFFTATDDFLNNGESGAGMLGTVEFNAPTLYRYANVSFHELKEQIGKENAIKGIKLFIDSFVNSIPGGKITTFANQSIPNFLMVNVRKDRPLNLSSAFERAVKSKEGYTEKSINALLEENNRVESIVEEPIKTFIIDLKGLNLGDYEDYKVKNISALLAELEETLEER